jgi:hypothetical protein
MARFRRVLGPLAGSWLLCQIAILTIVPVALAFGSAMELACTCSLSADGMCPMHHQQTPAGSKQCRMQNGADAAGSSLVSLSSPFGLLPSTTALSAPILATSAVVGRFRTVRDVILPPDAPPPRI